MTYTVRLDGSSANITNGNAQKVGTIQMTGGGGPVQTDDEGTQQAGQSGEAHRLSGRQDAHQRIGRDNVRPLDPFQTNLRARLTLVRRYFRGPRPLFRRAIFQVHLWTGIVAGLYIFIIGVTGSLLVFRAEFDALRLPKHWRALRTSSSTNAGTVIARLHATYPTMRIVSLEAPNSVNPTFVATLAGRRRVVVACDPATGEVLGPLPPSARWLTFVRRLHETLLLGGGTGRRWNGVGAALLLLLAGTGLVNWWPGDGAGGGRSKWTSDSAGAGSISTCTGPPVSGRSC